MTVARDLMSDSPTIVGTTTSAAEIARCLRDEGIGAVVICGDDQRLAGMVTDRDLAVEVVAAGRDPESTTAGDITSGREVVTIGADDDLDEAVRTMSQYAVRRLPVVDGDRVVGVLSQADVARVADADQVAAMLREISEAGDNTARG
jgi:CBS domain-containing protein